MSEAVIRRLRWYWPMEAGNVVLVPLLVFGLVVSSGGAVSLALIIGAAANAVLLSVGALYWRASLRRLQGDLAAFQFWIPLIARAQVIAAGLTLAVLVATGAEVIGAGGGWPPSLIGAVGLSALAVLEYLNYYHVQLQHFDNAADLKRLLSGQGFRRAHMARDIAAWRKTRASSI
ncbi:MAG: hypothetical protein H7124_13140 [Phycisphaerales bacterium]|nr:hypothetical protein [Hyphomonadaceae bacterium]